MRPPPPGLKSDLTDQPPTRGPAKRRPGWHGHCVPRSLGSMCVSMCASVSVSMCARMCTGGWVRKGTSGV